MPLRETVCVLRLSVTVSVPDAEPAVVGTKTTLMGQVDSAASCAEQVLVCWKGPEIDIATPGSAFWPELARVTVCALLG